MKLNKIIHIDRVTPRKFQYVKKLQNVSLIQQSTFVKAVPISILDILKLFVTGEHQGSLR